MDEFMHVAEIALPLLLQGLGTTAAISVLSILIAMVLGSAVGYMCLSKNKAVELIARAFIKIFEMHPFYGAGISCILRTPCSWSERFSVLNRRYNSWNVHSGLYRGYP